MRMTDADVVVNAVYVDPGDSNRVLLATDRGGVLASDDGGATFAASNQGISERKVAAVLVDRNNPEVLYAGVVNDKKYGGVFRSSDGGAHWEQLGSGLDGRDVFALAETKDGRVVAGTGHGIFVLEGRWRSAGGGQGQRCCGADCCGDRWVGRRDHPHLGAAERDRKHRDEDDHADAHAHESQHRKAGAGAGD